MSNLTDELNLAHKRWDKLRDLMRSRLATGNPAEADSAALAAIAAFDFDDLRFLVLERLFDEFKFERAAAVTREGEEG
jgi:hypothetical protein